MMGEPLFFAILTLPMNTLDPLLILRHGRIAAGMRVADFGCGGHGHFTFALADLVGHQGVVYAVDILPSVLEAVAAQAQHRGVSHVQAIRGDIERVASVPIPTGMLHRVILINTLHQVTDRIGVFVELKRVLGHGGLLLIVEPSQHRHIAEDRQVDEETAAALAQTAGFAPLRAFAPNAHHWGRVFQSIGS